MNAALDKEDMNGSPAPLPRHRRRHRREARSRIDRRHTPLGVRGGDHRRDRSAPADGRPASYRYPRSWCPLGGTKGEREVFTKTLETLKVSACADSLGD